MFTSLSTLEEGEIVWKNSTLLPHYFNLGEQPECKKRYSPILIDLHPLPLLALVLMF